MSELIKIDPYRWQIPQETGMNTPAMIYADHKLLAEIQGQGTLEQLRGVASLPGIVGPALAMPDAHQGYGFPIGGVAAFDPQSGVVSPGGVGYDINCGVRLLRSKLAASELSQGQLNDIADQLSARIPAGVGVGGGLKLSAKDLDRVLMQGAAWPVKQGQGTPADLEYCEAGGALPGADPEQVSDRAKKRGSGQLGTLGAGNHFIELAVVDEVYDSQAAESFGLYQDQAVVWIHSGSRGLGHQVCDESLRSLAKSSDAIRPKDRQLISVPPHSKAGRAYLGAMAAAANFAFANRQVLTHLTREALEMALQAGPQTLGLGLVYDVAHNVAKFEQHIWQGKKRELLIHRKGATRALGPGHAELPSQYRKTGQPVLLPGDMGRASFVLCGTATADNETFASSAHGAGRRLSRTQAKKKAQGRKLVSELAERGVLVRAAKIKTLAEEMPEAYKDAAQVVEVMHGSGIACKVVRTRPLVVIKG
jgi:tRNA-splicing ligase RtcB (3'-phosphate/5'-hydroxy nucleic acid ligase)